ncbi:YggT family protein [Schaalia sp. lx-100]|nr:YggT family protein [Schaalia sp. lx-260]MCD4557058.1 YggT family protein [Schaalia sp. lx-100]
MMILVARMVIQWVNVFQPRWRPPLTLLPLFNLCFWITDPPIRFFQRHIPPLRLGQGFAVDMGFIIVVLIVLIAQRFAVYLQYI